MYDSEERKRLQHSMSLLEKLITCNCLKTVDDISRARNGTITKKVYEVSSFLFLPELVF